MYVCMCLFFVYNSRIITVNEIREEGLFARDRRRKNPRETNTQTNRQTHTENYIKLGGRECECLATTTMKLKNEGQSRGEKGNHGQTTSQVFWQAEHKKSCFILGIFMFFY